SILNASFVPRLREYIEAHIDSPLRVVVLSAIAGKSAAHFSRGFRQSFGTSPHAYVMERRLARARELLVHSELSICEIAALTGRADQAHLTRRFRVAVGMTPSRYRLAKNSQF